ncbi:recombinase family protein [Parasphingorhabdus flavimaris]|uniref:recombinase family protein n=1 Tax=Parasphingorhabdus flavimaris TaxID=266812 RepID=UPI003001C016
MSRKIGYARVSCAEQRLDLQLNALKKHGCDKVYADHGLSGARKKRPELDAALSALVEGDSLVVWKLDRISRSIRDLFTITDDLNNRGCSFESLTDNIDTSSAMGEFFFHVLAAISQLERGIISERTKAGLEAARQRGVRLGRPRIHQIR